MKAKSLTISVMMSERGTSVTTSSTLYGVGLELTNTSKDLLNGTAVLEDRMQFTNEDLYLEVGNWNIKS